MYKVSHTKHGTPWDRIDFDKEWFRGGDFNSFRDIKALPVSVGMELPLMVMTYIHVPSDVPRYKEQE
jgi:hypothetical protein